MALSVPASISVPLDFEIGGHILFVSRFRLHKHSYFLTSSPMPTISAMVVVEAPWIFFFLCAGLGCQSLTVQSGETFKRTCFLENPQAHFLKKYRKPRASPTAGRDSSLCPAFPAVCLLFSSSVCFLFVSVHCVLFSSLHISSLVYFFSSLWALYFFLSLRDILLHKDLSHVICHKVELIFNVIAPCILSWYLKYVCVCFTPLQLHLMSKKQVRSVIIYILRLQVTKMEKMPFVIMAIKDRVKKCPLSWRFAPWRTTWRNSFT